MGQTVNSPSEAAATTPPALWNKASKGQHGKISTGWLTEFRDPRMKALVQEAIDKAKAAAVFANPVQAALSAFPALHNLSRMITKGFGKTFGA